MSGPQRWANRAGPRLSLIAAFLLALCAGLLTRPTPVKAAAFTAGNLVVVRVGDGSATLSNASTAVFLDEFSPSGAPIQSIGLPTSTTGGNAALTMSGSATSEGTLARSPNGAYLTLAGYDAAPGTASIGATTSATTNRIIGRIDSSGAINTTTRISDGYNTDNIRAAVTDDGTGFWASGNGATNTGGVRYVAFGSSGASTQLSTSVTNTRVPGIVGGQLYVSASSGTFRGLSTVGSGLPTTSGQTITGLPGFPTASGPSSYSFVLFDLSAGVAGLDTAYVADDRSVASGGGLQKWTFNGSTWALAYTLSSGLAGGLRGLTGIGGANPVLYATTADASANTLVTITDTGAGAVFTTLATAPTNTIFRGVALAPVAPQPDLAVAVSGPATATVGVPYSYTVTVSNVGGAAASGVEARFTLPASVTYNSASGTDGFGCTESSGTVACTGATIGAGTGATITVSVTRGVTGRVSAPAGAAVVDPSNTVAETNEGNNSSTSAVVTTVDAAPNTPPTIGVTSTEPRLPSPIFSGVAGDPTDPGAQLGLRVTVGDAETPAADLVLTASSSNPAVVPNNPANLAITGTGATRTLRVIPAGVGYATITLTVTDAGNQTATASLTYAASAAAITPTTSRFHTGAADISTGVAMDANFMFVANDEDQALRLYDRTNSGAPLASFDATASLNLTDMGGSGPREVDIEASARSGSRIYWVASHSNASGGNQRPNRSRLFATDSTGTGATSTLSFVGYYGGLKNDLIAWDQSNGHGKGANHYGFAASAATGVIPEDPDGAGFNIEAAEFAPDGSTLYLGFRAPIVPATNRTKALIVPVTNPAALVGSSPAAGPATFGAPIEFELGGRGIRELRKNSANEYLLLAGPPDTATGTAPKDFRLYSWTGNPGDVPLLRVANLTALQTGGSFESIVEVPSPLTSTSQIQLLSDNGDTVWYGDGVIAKELSNNPHKKFRSDRVTLGGQPPDTAITQQPSNPSAGTFATFAFTGTDNLTPPAGLTFECSLDAGAFAGCASPRIYSGLANGSHTVLVRAKDAAGNVDPTPASFTWLIDTTLPDTTAPETAITLHPTSRVSSTSATFIFTGTDDVAAPQGLTFECSLDGAAFAACANPQNYASLAQGSHTFLVRARDAAGNVDPSPASFSWIVDTIAPETLLTGQPPLVTTILTATFVFTGTDSGTGLAAFECSLDSGLWTDCESPQVYGGLAFGSHTFLVRAKDHTGNVDLSPAAHTWVVARPIFLPIVKR